MSDMTETVPEEYETPWGAQGRYPVFEDENPDARSART